MHDAPIPYEKLLSAALARGGDYADIFAQRTRSRSLSFEEGKVKQASESLRQGVGIRVQQGEATGYAVCEDDDPQRLLAAAGRAAAIAASGGVRPELPRLAATTLPNRYPQRRPLAQATLDERIAYARRASDHARAGDPRVQWIMVHVGDQLDQVTIATSDGIIATDSRPHLRVAVSLTGASGDRRESVWHGFGLASGLEGLERHSPESVASEALRRLEVRMRAIESPAGEMPVVIAPGEGGIMIHEAVGHGLEADFNRKGTGAYSGKVGEMVANPLVTIFDRADLEGDSGSLNVDDEGIVPGSTTLIERGRLIGYINDRLSARLMGVAPSGNGRRQDFSHIPQPRMRVTGMAAGADAPEEIVAGVARGLYVASIGGGSVDVTKGDFNFQVEEAYQIEDGRLGAPVRGACLIGNGPEVMRGIARLGNDLRLMENIGHCGKLGQSVPVGFGCPTTLIERMVVGGSRS